MMWYIGKIIYCQYVLLRCKTLSRIQKYFRLQKIYSFHEKQFQFIWILFLLFLWYSFNIHSKSIGTNFVCKPKYRSWLISTEGWEVNAICAKNNLFFKGLWTQNYLSISSHINHIQSIDCVDYVGIVASFDGIKGCVCQ